MRFIALFLLSIAASNSYAATAGWYGPYEVATIESADNGVYFIKPPSLAGFPDFGCGTLYVFFANGASLANRALSVGLSAQAMGKKVKFYLDGCSSNGYTNAKAIQIDPVW